MDATILIGVTFVAVTFVTLAIGLVLRDLVFGTGEAAGGGAFELRRLPKIHEPDPSAGPIGRFDGWFNRMIFEANLGLSPLTAICLLLIFGLPLAGALFLWTDDPTPGVIGMILGMAIPLAYLVYRRKTRMAEITSQLPDALDLLSRAIRAGESFDQAIHLAGHKTPEPLAIELRRCARQLDLGLGLPEVMRALARRLPLMEVRILASTLSVHRHSGGNLALTMERMASVIRDRMIYRRQLRATTAAGRFSAMLVASAGPLLFAYMFVFNPEYARRLVEQPLGQLLLAIAVVLELIGLAWVLSMLRTDY